MAMPVEQLLSFAQQVAMPRPRQYLRLCGLAHGPWDLAFVHWCGVQVFGAARWPLPLDGRLATFTLAVTLRNRPAPGAVFVLYSKHRQQYVHAGLCVERAAEGWRTVEGNTDLTRSRHGQAILSHVRNFGDRDRFIWWWPLLAPPAVSPVSSEAAV